MFGKYALPIDFKEANATVTGSAEDTAYPGQNLVAPTATGHLNLPSRPAKLTTTSGYWDLVTPSAITVVAAAMVYHNIDEGVDVTLEAAAQTIQITVPSKPDDLDDWTLSPWVEFSAITATTWRLAINSANSNPVQVGRLLLLGELRQSETDARYEGLEGEGRIIIADPTELGVETMYDLFGVQRRYDAEFLFRANETAYLRALWRSARNRVLPWLLIPDEDVNDAWFVRFEDQEFTRVQTTVGVNTHPYRVRELSRGLPWP